MGGKERVRMKESERAREPDFVRGWEGDKCVYGYSERPFTETAHRDRSQPVTRG